MTREDMKWYEELYNTYYERLYKLIRLKLWDYGASADDAHDIIQDVFLLSIKKDIRSHVNPGGWLFRAAQNYCLQYVRAHWKEDKKAHALEEIHVPDQFIESSEDEIMDTLKEKLSIQDFDLLKAYCIDKVPLAEISAQTGLSENAIYIRICRIRKQIRTLFLFLVCFLAVHHHR